jgi:uncharacterized oxidoreductase
MLSAVPDHGGLMERKPPAVDTFKSDVGDPTAIPALYDQVLKKFPALDTLVNNARIQSVQKFNLDQSLEDITREIEIRFHGPVLMITQFLPHLKTHKDAGYQCFVERCPHPFSHITGI